MILLTTSALLVKQEQTGVTMAIIVKADIATQRTVSAVLVNLVKHVIQIPIGLLTNV